jgi:hypothetical protein
MKLMKLSKNKGGDEFRTLTKLPLRFINQSEIVIPEDRFHIV